MVIWRENSKGAGQAVAVLRLIELSPEILDNFELEPRPRTAHSRRAAGQTGSFSASRPYIGDTAAAATDLNGAVLDTGWAA